MIPSRIALVGSGNVAPHLGRALGNRIGIVVSRNPGHAQALAKSACISQSGGYEDLRAYRPEMVIVSVADHALAEVAQSIADLPGEPLVVHTSGTMPKESLACVSPRTGVLYPLQTFSKDVAVDMSRVPFFTEAQNAEDLKTVDIVAHSLSATVHHADAAKRQVLHIAGVFSSNFVNILLEMVEDILAGADYPLDTVQPLVEATVAKAFEAGPHAAQTGPARRGDTAVMAKHAAALPEDKRAVYELLSQYIVKSHTLAK